MFRTLTALFALSLTTAAQADTTSLNARIQHAAEGVCAPLLSSTSLLYKKWYADCVTASEAKITADVTASRGTSTALLSK